ncbi:type 2 lanthipeptide synthetase LanM family protein [Anaeromyxobacter terrae]|uniref:type 2 lanthipeptide synthetase LanM family protein n=1 Tax=Anaeromyxobacter terrae TaxID=2925406 RepID=UPI001F5A19C2|nr:type 2 lanthipeptide synthetase LanM family protein [Anaeromyxobacter sp. SG22]
MAHEACSPASGLTPHLYSALSLGERAACLRRGAERFEGSRPVSGRGAAALERWRSREPFSADELLQRRLRLDGLSEAGLATLLGLPPDAYSDLLAAPPEWARELEALYLAPPPDDDVDPAFARYAEEGTNGFLWLAYPLVAEALRRFRARAARIPARGVPFDAASAEGLVVPRLLETLEHALEVVMVLELNVARVQGTLTGETPEARFRGFCERLRERDERLAIAREYPVLFRSLHAKATSWLECSLELLERLHADWELIRARLPGGAEAGHLSAIRFGAGDTHRRGQTVAILEFSTGFKLVYKPHGQSVDVHFGELLEWLNAAGFEAPFRVLRILDRGGYGWSEFVAHEPCTSREEVERFYRRLGGYLAAFRMVRARDMHFENVIAAGEHPMPVDLETMFHNDAGAALRDDPAIAAFQSSVMQVMLLPQPVQGASGEVVDMSGFGASSDQSFPLGRSSSWEGAATDEMRVGHGTTVPRMVARNRPKLDGEEVDAAEWAPAFVEGFRRVYGLVEARRDELLAGGGILERFAGDEVRFVARPTATYAMLLRPTHHPDLLRNAIDWDHAFDGLWLDAARQPHLMRLIPAEARDLQRGDVPVFTSRPDSRDLWTSDGERIPDVFDRPAMALVREGLSRLGADDLARQESFIRAAIASVAKSAPSPDGGPTAPRLRPAGGSEPIHLARAVGDLLCRDVVESDACASWIGTSPLGDGRSSIHPLDPGLYDGLSGCSMFLAYLARATGDGSYERVARKALTLARRHVARGRASGALAAGLGAFTGLGGIIYTLSHLAVLWDDAALLEEAKALAADVPALVGADETLDVIGGSAGAIAALHVLNGVSASDDLLTAAVLCGERLLQRQQPQGAGAGWRTDVASDRPLTGFSHGAAGIAWALLKLAAWSGEERFRRAAEAAIAYERSTFVAARANWPDYRARPGGDPADVHCEVAWCHGAPGIGLARIDGLPYLDDAEVRGEIRIALQTTIDSGFGSNHSLCHGALGNLDLLLHAARHVDESWWTDAGQRLARETLAGIAARGCLLGAPTHVAPPGLMTGLAGVGYGLLRLARPERVPSVLVLAPPTDA